GFGTLAAQGGAFTADAGGGIAFDAASATGAITFVAGGTVAGGNLTSPGTVSVSGARVVLGDVIAGAVSLASGSDILFDLIRSANPVTLTASNGLIGANTGAGDIESGADVTLLAQSIALGLVDAGGSIAAGTTVGDMTFARLEAGSNIALDSAGGIDVGHAEAGGNFTAAAAAAFVTGPDSIITGGDIVINAGGPVTLGNSSAGGLVDVTGSQIDFSALVAGETVTLLTEPSVQTAFGNGNVTGDSLTAGAGASSITSTFGSVTIAGDTTVVGGLSVVADANITLGAVSALGGNLLASAGGDIVIGTGSASGDASLSAGQSISLTGDLNAGGTVALAAQTGAIAARDLIAGAGVSAISAADMALRDVILSGGGASLVSGGDIAVRNVSGADGAGVLVTANGRVDFAGIDSAGAVSLLAETGEIVGGTIASGAGVTVDGEAVTLALIAAAGDVTGTAGSGAFSVGSITSTGGAIGLQGATAVTAGSLAAATDLTVTGGAIDLGMGTAGGSVALVSGVGDGIVSGALVAGNAIAIDAGTGGFSGTTLVADGAVTVASAAGIAFDSAAAGASVGLSSSGAGDIATTTITAGADVTVSTGGSFIADSVTASQSGTGVVNIAAVTGITLNTLVGNTALLAASGGAVRVNVDIDMTGLVNASGQSVFLRSTGNLAALANASSGDIDIETLGDLGVSGAQADAGDVRLVSSGGNAMVANVRAREFSPGTGGKVLIEAGENLAVAGEVTAASALTMRAGERASIDAAAVGREIDLRASDVAIGSSGALGSLEATETIDISGGGIARIGGDATSASGFAIDNDEFSRIAASQSIAISASTAIVLDDLDIRVASGTGATGNLRGEGRIDFRAAEGIDVIGEVVMTGATADNALGLETGGDVFLDASTGLLEINDGAGNFLGSIEVVASNFYAMTEQALTDVQAAADIAAINDRLAQNDGIDNPDGLIRTGTLDITTVTSDVFIQNTAPGTRFGERRGFTVDELLISDPSGTNQPIVINGIIAGATGVDAVTLAQISSAFDPGSTINGCLIANPGSCVEFQDRVIDQPIQDLIEGQLEGDTPVAGLLDTPLFELREAADGQNDPLIDDPVTGAGNEDLWVGECEGEAAKAAMCAEPAE
ncbi:MAG: beta strand repeat-containing protein, partial [Sphingomonadaceae bacterium]